MYGVGGSRDGGPAVPNSGNGGMGVGGRGQAGIVKVRIAV
jgi:hypothetical protein